MSFLTANASLSWDRVGQVMKSSPGGLAAADVIGSYLVPFVSALQYGLDGQNKSPEFGKGTLPGFARGTANAGLVLNGLGFVFDVVGVSGDAKCENKWAGVAGALAKAGVTAYANEFVSARISRLMNTSNRVAVRATGSLVGGLTTFGLTVLTQEKVDELFINTACYQK